MPKGVQKFIQLVDSYIQTKDAAKNPVSAKTTLESFNSACTKNEKSYDDSRPTVFIFAGNKGHHQQKHNLYSRKSGGGLAEVADRLGEMGAPTLSLPTTGMDDYSTNPATKQIAKDAVVDLWRAVGFGCNLAIPTRHRSQRDNNGDIVRDQSGKPIPDPNNNTYFDNQGLFAGDTEPAFWGGIEKKANKDLANYYSGELKFIQEFIAAPDNAAKEAVFDKYKILPGDPRREAYEQGLKAQEDPQLPENAWFVPPAPKPKLASADTPSPPAAEVPAPKPAPVPTATPSPPAATVPISEQASNDASAGDEIVAKLSLNIPAQQEAIKRVIEKNSAPAIPGRPAIGEWEKTSDPNIIKVSGREVTMTDNGVKCQSLSKLSEAEQRNVIKAQVEIMKARYEAAGIPIEKWNVNLKLCKNDDTPEIRALYKECCDKAGFGINEQQPTKATTISAANAGPTAAPPVIRAAAAIASLGAAAPATAPKNSATTAASTAPAAAAPSSATPGASAASAAVAASSAPTAASAASAETTGTAAKGSATNTAGAPPAAPPSVVATATSTSTSTASSLQGAVVLSVAQPANNAWRTAAVYHHQDPPSPAISPIIGAKPPASLPPTAAAPNASSAAAATSPPSSAGVGSPPASGSSAPRKSF